MYSLLVFIIILYILNLNTSDKKFHNVKSSINNKSYLIEKTTKVNDEKKANILANIDIKIDILIKSLSKKSEHRKRLENAYIKLRERRTTDNIGYTLNKGDTIGLCIKENENALFFVVLHELAHVITPEYGHTPLFWDNFKMLVELAIKKDLYQYKNYNENPITYCNKEISYNPVKK